MKTAEIPANELLRLHTLRNLIRLDPSFEERFDRITRIVKRLLKVPVAMFTIVDEHTQWFKAICGQGIDSAGTRDNGFCAHTILNSEMMIVPDTLKDERFFDNPAVTNYPNVRFYAGCPIDLGQDIRIGALCVIDSEPRELQADELDLLRDFGNMIAADLLNLSLGTTDELTGITNRRGFLIITNYILKLIQAQKMSAALFFIDLNEFKKINDQFGHSVGDEALITTAKLLVSSVRSADIVARLSGDEFCILCIDFNPEHITQMTQDISEVFAHYNATSHKPYKIQYSIGCEIIDFSQNLNVVEIIDRADKKMYQEKHKK